jgi:hypothetical protein
MAPAARRRSVQSENKYAQKTQGIRTPHHKGSTFYETNSEKLQGRTSSAASLDISFYDFIHFCFPYVLRSLKIGKRSAGSAY